ncbi:MAG: ATP-dependent helicase HrpB [Polyangiaceae bacterium]|nr:ATP-dependent helicase HrpB [Polyangiaceae bacterium]
MALVPLPVDAHLPEIRTRLGASGALVLEAEPGAGKTTRATAALLDELPGNIWVSEPRRVAARLAAARVASELGERVGETVGYSVRFEEVTGPRTRLCFMTDGVLLRRLLAGGQLAGTSAIVIDELHERSTNADQCLALAVELRRTSRPDLRLLVMSATLDGPAVAEYLGCESVRVAGRLFPLTIEHLPRPDERPLEKQVSSAVRTLLVDEHPGDVLVFLPGAREIRACQQSLQSLAAAADFEIALLHGDLPLAEQTRALEPGRGRKVVLSTNVAESSITVPGVTAVIDSGLSRVAVTSPWTGIPRLQTLPISRASATQRAGRAGRVAPGRVLRLYTHGDLQRRPARDTPEIARTELAELVLSLRARGFASVSELAWLTPPPEAAVASAESLLCRLGAVTTGGALTPLGREMSRLPLPPRLARLLVEGGRRGVGDRAATIVALLSERDIRRSARAGFGARSSAHAERGPSDLLELESLFEQARDARDGRHAIEALGLDPRAVRSVAESRRQLLRLARPAGELGSESGDEALLRAVLCAFVDRLARRQRAGEATLILASGETARQADTSVVIDAEFLVAVDVEQSRAGRAGTVVRLASAVQPEWLLEGFESMLLEEDRLQWNDARRRVERVTRLAIGSVVLDESRSPAPPSPEASALLADALLARGSGQLRAEAGLDSLAARVALLREALGPEVLPPLDENALGDALAAACEGATSEADVAQLALTTEFTNRLTPEQRRLLGEQAPPTVTLRGGRSVTVHYEAGKPPWVESRLQDFFGMSEGPTLARGRIPVTLHLLAPNGRAVQVSQDLSGFWQRHYPAIRKELMRKYPRHLWPEDGARATPPTPGRSR